MKTHTRTVYYDGLKFYVPEKFMLELSDPNASVWEYLGTCASTSDYRLAADRFHLLADVARTHGYTLIVKPI